MKIWIATGGTGGHIFPALAVAREFLRRGHIVTVSSDGRGMKMVRADSKYGVAFVWASGVGAKSKLQQAVALSQIGVSSVLFALRFMIFRPDRVVAFGGYSSVPILLAARLWKIPTFLHEQNGHIGRANLFALRWTDTLMTSFPNVHGINRNVKIVYTGLPVRAGFAPDKKEKLDNRILITGGSLGAQILDDVVPIAMAQMPAAMRKKLFIVHQTRPENVLPLQKHYLDAGVRANVLSFIHDMAGEITAADLVVGRSGASTVVELQTIGRPAILVPLAINPDQLANAENFASCGGGMVVPQNKFTAKWLSATIAELFDNPPRLIKMGDKARVGNNAVANIVKTVLAK